MAKGKSGKGPPLGAHVSIAGGVVRAAERAEALKATALQIFTSSNSQWRVRRITGEEAEAFREAVEDAGILGLLAHNSYLINLGSPKATLSKRSLRAMLGEVDRADQLGLDYLVFHPGSHVGSGEEAGLARIAEGVNRLYDGRPNMRVTLCFEVTAGQGTSLGYEFEHLAELFDQIDASERVGVCLDTCHLFASGHDIRTRAGWMKTVRALDKAVGVEKVRCFHLNDSKNPLGSRVDRHEHIGKGFLGKEAFRAILNDRRFQTCPMVLETPKGEGLAEDRLNLRVLRRLIG